MNTDEQWLRRFLRFHRMRHPRQMGETEINAFLSHLATQEKVSASTQNQALAALQFSTAACTAVMWETWTG